MLPLPAHTFASVVRRDDFLALEFDFVNLRLEGPPARLVRDAPGQPAYIVVHFPAQHVTEEAFLENEGGTLLPGPVPVRALVGGPTRLVFKLPDGTDSLPYSLAAVLDWKMLVSSLAPNALPPGATTGPGIATPGDLETAIELPAGLILSPDASAIWSHSVGPVTHADRTELWHTRLGVRRVGESGQPEVDPTATPFVRAIWSQPLGDPFVTSLNDSLREQIARLSSDFSLRAKSPFPFSHPQFQAWLHLMQQMGIPLTYTPTPITAQRLMLSPAGGWARLQSTWRYPIDTKDDSDLTGYPVMDLEQWQHVATLGRDHYVRTVQKGFLCPTGNRASLITVSERKFSTIQIGKEETPGGTVGIFGATAYLRKYEYIVVQEPEKDYAALGPAYTNQGREMPLRRIRITTLETPKLMRLTPSPPPPPPAASAPFWPSVDAAQPFLFQMVAHDWDGQQCTLALPLLFVPAAAPAISTRITYNASVPEWRTADLANQSVAFAPSVPGKRGATALKTTQLTFSAATPIEAGLPPRHPRFLPQLFNAKVGILAVDQLIGRSAPVDITLADSYLASNIDGVGNKGEVFASLTKPLDLPFAAEKGGGLVKPNTMIQGLSRSLGTVANPAKINAGTFDTSAFSQARLLGGIALSDILAPTTFDPNDVKVVDLRPEQLQALLDQPGTLLKVPVLTTRPLYAPGVDPAAPGAAPTAVETRFVWKPAIQDWPAAGGIFQLKTKLAGVPAAQLVVRARKVAALDGTASEFSVEGTLRDFALDFVGAMQLNFRSLRFRAEQGKKLDVSAEGVDLVFQGPLKFVNTLKNILPANGFSDPPSLSVTAEGVKAGYVLGVPSVGVGVFSLQNLSLTAGLSLPFVDKPAGVRFGISERHHPFLVTVALFGGGGFFSMALNAKGIEQIEAAIEFGASINLNLGIASGGVYVMAGIYFAMAGKDVKLTGYLRCGGYLSVLGLISISLEFYLAFTYRSKGSGGEVWGQASLTVCVKVACFSKSVTLTVERRFAGAAGDPNFEELVEPDDWQTYCRAFA